MNWLDRSKSKIQIKLGLAIFLLALILFSCEEPNNIGEDIISGRDTVGVFALDIPVTSGVVKQDSVIAFRDFLLFGEYNDPIFGKIYAESYVSVIPTSLIQVPDISSAEFDSITLKIKVAYIYGDDVFSPQDLKIYQLNDSLSYFRIEGSDTLLNVPYTHVKQEYQRLLADTSINLSDLETFKEDSIFFSIRLDDAFGNEILNKAIADPSTFTNFNEINAFLKGFAFVPGEYSSTVFGLDVVSTTNSLANSIVTLHYHTASDTLEYTFGMNQFRYNYIQGDRSGTELAELTESDIFYPANSKIYVQAGTGITSFLDFSAIEQVKQTAGRMAINSAMLFIDVDPSTEYVNPPATLNVYAADSLGYPASETRGDTLFYFYSLNVNSGGQLVLLSQLGEQPNSIAYTADKERYMFDITLFLQGMIDGSNPYRRIVFYPHLSLNQNKDVVSTPRINRFTASPENIKLRVYYTSL